MSQKQLNFYRRKDCRLCHSTTLKAVLSLEPTPPANELVDSVETAKLQERFPLEIFFCEKCQHVQLLDVVSPERLFRNYVYVSGTSLTFVKHFNLYADFLISKYKPGKEKIKVLEIGSNDGTLLKALSLKGVEVLGIDPASDIAHGACQAGVDTIGEFFDLELAKTIKKDRGAFDIVVANNVFAHIDNLDEAILAVKEILRDDGIFCIEVSYLLDVYKKVLFDTIYHEHLCYHSVNSLKQFFNLHSFEIIEVIGVDTHGGSIRVVSQKIGAKRPIESSVKKYIMLEKDSGILDATQIKKFATRIHKNGEKLRHLLDKKIQQGQKIVGYGLPAKATTLMYHYKLGNNYFEYIVDDNPLKHHKFSPGKGVEIRPMLALQQQPPDVIVILAWNFSKLILEKLQNFINGRGEVIIPLPNLTHIGAYNGGKSYCGR